ncbi:MAG: type VI secretion system tube protein Hcp [Chloroflexi bacterium]|nr:type VI secretion system tube protein Hcp [Chloroflexota bacterium]
MRRGIELPAGGISPRTLLLGIVAVAAVFTAVTLYVRSGPEPDLATADSASAPASAPSDGAYIKIGDIKGEATDSAHGEWIDILSFSQSITRPMSSGISGSTRQRGAASFGEIVLVKAIDKSSPKLQEAVATGQVMASVTLDLTTSSGDRPATYLKYELKDVLITNYRVSGGAAGDDRPTETISLNFAEINVVYTEQSATGRAGGKVEYSWKVEEGVR